MRMVTAVAFAGSPLSCTVFMCMMIAHSRRTVKGWHRMSTATTARATSTFSSGAYLASLMAELDRAQISRRIREARLLAGFKSQEQLGDVMHVHFRTVQDWENPKHQNVPWDRLDELAAVCGVTKIWLLHGDEAPAQASGSLDEVLRRLGSIEAQIDEAAAGVSAALEKLEQTIVELSGRIPQADVRPLEEEVP